MYSDYTTHNSGCKMITDNGYGGARAGAGRKKGEIERKPRHLSFSDDDWAKLKSLSESQRKVADFIMKCVEHYIATKGR